MRQSILTCSVVALAALTFAGCSGSGFAPVGAQPYQNGYADQNHGGQPYNGQAYNGQAYAQNSGCVATAAQPVCGGAPAYAEDLRGTYPVANPHGTVLANNAPYGSAVYHNDYVQSQLRPAHNSNVYVNLGVMNYDVDDGPTGLQGRIGYNVNQYLGAEIEGSRSIGDGTIEGVNGLSVKYAAAAFAVGKLPITDRFSLLARGGYHQTKFGQGNTSGKVDDFAYGVGAEYLVTPNDGIRVDLTRYEMDFPGDDYDAVAVSYVRRF